MESLKEQIQKASQIISEKMHECDTPSGDTMMCSINEAFEDFHSNGHNCLGCNLQDEIDFINQFLNDSLTLDHSEKDFFKVYLMLLYLLSEKLFEIIKIIGLPTSYKESELKVLRTIKLWANFHKHPKAFILTHHPEYLFENDESLLALRNDTRHKIVDIDYVNKYYRGEDSNKYRALVKELKNNEHVIVVIPKIDRLTDDFCTACSTIVQIVKENKAYKEILNDLTTLENYFEAEYNEAV